MQLIDRRFLNVSFVVAAVANAPTANFMTGSQYIVGSSPTGAFANATPKQLARYTGSKWKFFTPKAGNMEVFNIATNEFLRFDGSDWTVIATLSSGSSSSGGSGETYTPITPVLNIVATGTKLPTACETGDKFLRTSSGKFYTAVDTNEWNSGVYVADGDRYASTTDFKIYEFDETENDFVLETIPNGSVFFNKGDKSLYTYDNEFIKAGASADTAGGEAFTVETHVLTTAEATAKSFTLANAIKSGSENSILLFINNLLMRTGTDFTASGNSISWGNKNLDGIGLRNGDVFVIQYVQA